MVTNAYPLLETIDDPATLRRLDRRSLPRLADELRAFLIETVSRTGGHLASNLGTVELALALHYVYDTPEDRIVWDVGHQSYPHKVLTGRREAMDRLRMYGGISGFPRRDESRFDAFGTAHSSTSISAALGMAVAARAKGESRKAIAVIGDGAMSAGMAFEALNNAGVSVANLLVILNDNEMAISPPVGALTSYLARLVYAQPMLAARRAADRVLATLPPLQALAKRVGLHAKGMMVPSTMFEQFGFEYIGPIDGHDLDTLVPTLQNLRDMRGPVFLHVVTRKGQGYKLAEADPVKYHGVSRFEPAAGIVAPKTGSRPAFTQIFGDWLCDMAEADARLVGITPAMREGSGMIAFAERFPARYHDVGIAEQHAVTFAAGLACEGMKPVVAIYSTFLQRAYDQLVHDVQIQKLPVLFAIDRGGLVGADGATHHGVFDLSYLRCIPNLTVMTPADENECRQMLTTGFRMDTPAAVRYPRGAGAGVQVDRTLESLPIGKAQVRREGRRVAILAFGPLLDVALAVAEEFDATVVNMRFVKPLDDALVARMAERHDLIVTLEENVVMGGAGSAVAESLAEQGITVPLLHLGLPDRFVDHGDPAQLLAECGLNKEGVAARLHRRLASLQPSAPAPSVRVA